MSRSPQFAKMTVEQLVEHRDAAEQELKVRLADLQRKLRGPAAESAPQKRKAIARPHKRRILPKYKGPNGETWSGRGLKPRWLAAELKKGRKIESFAINARASEA